MSIVAGLQAGYNSDFIIVVPKKIGDVDNTKNVFTDMWHLVNP